jgi:hypothetical protein
MGGSRTRQVNPGQEVCTLSLPLLSLIILSGRNDEAKQVSVKQLALQDFIGPLNIFFP